MAALLMAPVRAARFLLRGERQLANARDLAQSAKKTSAATVGE